MTASPATDSFLRRISAKTGARITRRNGKRQVEYTSPTTFSREETPASAVLSDAKARLRLKAWLIRTTADLNTRHAQPSVHTAAATTLHRCATPTSSATCTALIRFPAEQPSPGQWTATRTEFSPRSSATDWN